MREETDPVKGKGIFCARICCCVIAEPLLAGAQPGQDGGQPELFVVRWEPEAEAHKKWLVAVDPDGVTVVVEATTEERKRSRKGVKGTIDDGMVKDLTVFDTVVRDDAVHLLYAKPSGNLVYNTIRRSEGRWVPDLLLIVADLTEFRFSALMDIRIFPGGDGVRIEIDSNRLPNSLLPEDGYLSGRVFWRVLDGRQLSKAVTVDAHTLVQRGDQRWNQRSVRSGFSEGSARSVSPRELGLSLEAIDGTIRGDVISGAKKTQSHSEKSATRSSSPAEGGRKGSLWDWSIGATIAVSLLGGLWIIAKRRTRRKTG